MNAINRRDESVFQFAGNGFIRRQHEFLDQLMGLVVFDPFEPNRSAFRVQPHFHLWEIKIERALLETLLAQERGQFPGDVEPLAQADRWRAP